MTSATSRVALDSTAPRRSRARLDDADATEARAAIISVCFHVVALLILSHALRHSFSPEGPEGVAVGMSLTTVTRTSAPSAASASSVASARSVESVPSKAAGPRRPTAVDATPRISPRMAPTPPVAAGRIVTHATGAPVALSLPRWKAPAQVHAGPQVVDTPMRPASATVTTVASAPSGGSRASGGVEQPGTEGAPASPAPFGAPSGSGQPMRADLALYSSQMGMRLRQFHHLYFQWKHPDDWTIARYRVDRQGRAHDIEIVDSTTPGELAQRVLLVIEQASPFAPLPEGLESLEVVELFWTTPRSPWMPGTRAEALSLLPDGREITPRDSSRRQ